MSRETRLWHVVREFVTHYQEEYPHQGMGNVPLTKTGDDPQTLALLTDEVVCRERLGGLLSHYHGQAA